MRVPAALASVSVAGFDPVGQVFGTTVLYLGSLHGGPCFTGGFSDTMAERLRTARQAALDHVVAQCRALGGDGVVGMRMHVGDFLSDATEFTVTGMAVRARSATRPCEPFATHVSGPDLAKLLRGGWVPCALVFGVAVASRHFDDDMFQQTRRGLGAAGNREVTGYTELVAEARRNARAALRKAVFERGGRGAVVQEMTLRHTERPCPLVNQHSDYLAEATILGSAIVPLGADTDADTDDTDGRVGGRAPLTIMRLDPRPGNGEPAPDAAITPKPGLSLNDRAWAYWAGRGGRSW